MSSPVALVCTHPKPSAGRLAPAWGSRVTSQPAGQEGLEPPTAGFGDRDSSQLSYCPLVLSQACSRSMTEDHQMLKCTLPAALPSNRRTARRYAMTAHADATPRPAGWEDAKHGTEHERRVWHAEDLRTDSRDQRIGDAGRRCESQ